MYRLRASGIIVEDDELLAPCRQGSADRWLRVVRPHGWQVMKRVSQSKAGCTHA
jgi:hypothetical protein